MTDSNNESPPVKRPYATLDLKATEIKVSPIGAKAAPASPAAAPTDGPKPAPASSYATFQASGMRPPVNPGTTEPPASKPAGAQASFSAAPSASAASTTAKPAETKAATAAKDPAPAPQIVVKKRGGFFSHLAASIIGGAIALAGAQWAVPQFGLERYLPQIAATGGGLTQRLEKLERLQAAGDLSTQFKNAEARLAALEKTAAAIPDIAQSQSRLVAETKAALAAAASDAGAPDQIERLTSVETRLNAMAEAGATDPAAGRLEQLAALTGKVSDLETSLATQLAALRKSVAGDVEARIAAAAEASEAAKSGTQRIDRELAGLKTEAASLAERLEAAKAEADRANTNLKAAQEETAALKAALDALKANVAKPADVASAITPVAEKIAALEANLQSIVKAEEDRRQNAERIVLSLELQNLKRALDRGQKFETELAEVQKASGGKFDLAVLANYKDAGVPTLTDLTRDFKATANAVIDADSDAAEGSVVDRLIAGAKSVVRVRKVSHNPEDKSAEAIAGRMEGALKAGQLAALLDEAQALPAKSKDAAQPFLDKVTARVSVDKAVAMLEGQLKTSLSGPAAEPQKTTP